MGKSRRRIPESVRREVVRLASEGLSRRDIIERCDVSVGSVSTFLRPFGGVYRPEAWKPSPSRLGEEDRRVIASLLELEVGFAQIGRRLGRATSTISREVNGNGGRHGYDPLAAHLAARQRARRPKPTKLATCPQLCAEVIAGLSRLWSPQQISKRLRLDFGDDPTMQISHETIYKSLYVQGRGELRRELAQCLRTGRAQRRPQGRLETRGRIRDMVLISQRPAEVADRAVPGHWEGDLIIGKNQASAMGTLVERTSRYVLLLHLPQGRDAHTVRTAMTQAIATLPAALMRTITWDQGREMSQHAQFRIDTGVQIYFCDPHAPWQRGSNENTNGLLRQYFPKGTDLSIYTPADLQAAADSLNGRPRQTLGWMTPSEKLAQIVASTG
jgi:transposase, IS30 family